METKKFNWKVFFIIWVASVFGMIAIYPYSLALQKDTLALISLPIPLWQLILIQIVQNSILFGLAALIGLFFANKIGLGAPILEAKLAGENIWERLKAYLPLSIILGVVASILIIVLDLAVFSPLLLAELGAGSATAGDSATKADPLVWQGFLASFYGGINEEVLLRLLLFSLLAWLGKFISHTEEGRPTLAILWIANIFTAVLFGLGHLPTTALAIPLTPLVITRAILLNGLAGIAFGYLYLKKGIESAMVSHFSADIVLHVLFPLVLFLMPA